MRPKIKRTLLFSAGFISVTLGMIGMVLPLLPTTPFLLLAAGCFFKSSERWYNWLMNHKYLGTYIRNYREHKAITLQTKIVTIALLWITISISAVFAVSLLSVRILLGLIAVGVTLHILHFKTLK